MPRKRTSNKHLPPRVYQRGPSFYYVLPNGKWVGLGRSEAEMYRRLAEILDGITAPKLRDIWQQYAAEVLPKKAPKTQYEQKLQWARLDDVFGECRPEEVKASDIAAYLDTRKARVAANREIALLSHIYRKAIRWGLAERNPCTGVEKNREQPDDRYITDEEFWAVHQAAPVHVQQAMELAYYTGQRQADILALRRDQLQDEGIAFQQAKTRKRLIVGWSPALRSAVDRALAVESQIASVWVLHTRKGQRYTASGFQSTWQKFIKRCVERGVIAERFTFRAIRAKARSDGSDKRLLGHQNPEAMARYYQRKPEVVRPVEGRDIGNDLEKRGAS